ncbi:response regulator transcription factor [Mycolicibacterium tokaiense]|uniref:Response regulator receiver protein n=1 Tax=Mycolicibacterium tokaiense TaxID=39695 RepID=A0A378TGI9_9MYCO|nr:response regulator [Mycolicibacterium tokaiense]BBY85579.1 response regulator [Mycolicibacterium tokaiense]STZ59908.1 response regulator receiver protein [Mycolicibacterium tokaiense]
MRCLIVDDSAAFRVAATSMLERAGFNVVGIAATEAEALDCTHELHPDVILLDIDLGAESGFDVAQALHRAGPPEPSVILISTHDEQDFADLIADSPALGFLPKFALSPESIRRLVQG